MSGGTKYLRARDIAALTGMSIRTIRRWIEDETLPSTKIGGARLVATDDLKAALSAPHRGPEEAADAEEECEE